MSAEHPAATCRGCGGPTKDALVYCDDCYCKGGRTDSAATSRLSPRAMLHRWAFMVMCWAGGVTIAVTWHGRTADWIGGMVYGIGIGRLILRDD